MKRLTLILISALALTGCKKSDVADPHGAPMEKTAPGGMGGPPAIPPYQMRALASATGGEALFSNRCGSCHLAGGMGTNLLTKQMMMAKRPPTDGLLANRTDLTADYVKGVVRQGKLAMPRLTKVDVTDADLDAIAAYLGKGK
jgi:mono/diheme cytochrome c family protein